MEGGEREREKEKKTRVILGWSKNEQPSHEVVFLHLKKECFPSSILFPFFAQTLNPHVNPFSPDVSLIFQRWRFYIYPLALACDLFAVLKWSFVFMIQSHKSCAVFARAWVNIRHVIIDIVLVLPISLTSRTSFLIIICLVHLSIYSVGYLYKFKQYGRWATCLTMTIMKKKDYHAYFFIDKKDTKMIKTFFN